MNKPLTKEEIHLFCHSRCHQAHWIIALTSTHNTTHYDVVCEKCGQPLGASFFLKGHIDLQAIPRSACCGDAYEVALKHDGTLALICATCHTPAPGAHLEGPNMAGMRCEACEDDQPELRDEELANQPDDLGNNGEPIRDYPEDDPKEIR